MKGGTKSSLSLFSYVLPQIALNDHERIPKKFMSLDTTTKTLIEQLIDRKLAMIPVVASMIRLSNKENRLSYTSETDFIYGFVYCEILTSCLSFITSNYARIPEEEEMNEVKNIISLRLLNKKRQDHG